MTSAPSIIWTESDLFLSDYPLPLLRSYSDQTLAEHFNYPVTSSDSASFRNELINHLWRKYDRIDLLPLTELFAQLPSTRLDDLVIARRYSDQTEISLSQFKANFNQYTPLSLKRVRNQLKPLLIRLDLLNSSQVNDLIRQLNRLNLKIFRRLNRILSSYRVILH